MKRVKGVKYIMTEVDQTMGVECTMQCTDDTLYNCALETYIKLLTNVTSINLMLKGLSKKKNTHGHRQQYGDYQKEVR